MQMIEIEDNNEAEISCPMCGTKNIQTKGLETAIMTECEHLESITSNLVWGEMEIDKNKILQKAFEKHDPDGNLGIEEFFNISTFLLSESGILDDVEYSDYRNTRRGIRIDGFNWNPF